jgi:hypothetical protein
MTFKKRGLGRGLEALLADDSVKEDNHQPTKDMRHNETHSAPVAITEVDNRTAMIVELFKSIQREHLILLEEAEVLRALIEEFEALVRADQS